MSSCPQTDPMPSGSVCGDQPDCMIEFEGYRWWTNYPLNKPGGSGYYFNGQQWDPRQAWVDGDGLHLQMKETQLPGGPLQWSSVEVLLWNKVSDPVDQRIYPGYGTYLVAASVVQSTPNNTFNDLANNCCFGAFTYRYPETSGVNPNHELDMIEASRFGRSSSDPQNAQFTLQLWTAEPDNVHYIEIQDGISDITTVMDWPGADQQATFKLYYGIYDNVPPASVTPAFEWPIPQHQYKYVPTDNCQTLHLNLWRQPPNQVTPNGIQEVVVKKVIVPV